MQLSNYQWKFMILKILSGTSFLAYKDSDMLVGFLKDLYFAMVALNLNQYFILTKPNVPTD